MMTVEQTTKDKFAPYVAGLLERDRKQRQQQRQRAIQALKVAQNAANILRQQYGATRVRLFGSVLHPESFHEQSDIDLGVEGLAPRDYLTAWAKLNHAGAKFKIDLVDPKDCSPYIWEAVENNGMDI